MAPNKSWLARAGRALAERLDRLRYNLDTLRDDYVTPSLRRSVRPLPAQSTKPSKRSWRALAITPAVPSAVAFLGLFSPVLA